MEEKRKSCDECNSSIMGIFEYITNGLYVEGNTSLFQYEGKSFQFKDNQFLGSNVNEVISDFIFKYINAEVIKGKGKETVSLLWIKDNLISSFRQIYQAFVAFLKYGVLTACNNGLLEIDGIYCKDFSLVEVSFINLLFSMRLASIDRHYEVVVLGDQKFERGLSVVFSRDYTDSIPAVIPGPNTLYVVIDDIDRPRTDQRFCLPLVPSKKIVMVCQVSSLIKTVMRYIVGNVEYFLEGSNYDRVERDVDCCCYCQDCPCMEEMVEHDLEYMIDSASIDRDYDVMIARYEDDHVGEEPCKVCDGDMVANLFCPSVNCYGTCSQVHNHFIPVGNLHDHLCCIGLHGNFSTDRDLYLLIGTIGASARIPKSDSLLGYLDRLSQRQQRRTIKRQEYMKLHDAKESHVVPSRKAVIEKARAMIPPNKKKTRRGQNNNKKRSGLPEVVKNQRNRRQGNRRLRDDLDDNKIKKDRRNNRSDRRASVNEDRAYNSINNSDKSNRKNNTNKNQGWRVRSSPKDNDLPG